MTTTQVRRIDEVAAVFNGKTPSKSEQRGSGHPVLKIKDVDALGKFRGTFSGHIGADLAQKHVKQQLAGGETLVLNAAHSVTHVASKTFYADQEVAGSLATGEWLIIRWCTESVDSRFGNHWINAPDTRFRIRRLVNGIHLYPKDVARLQIPLPPLDEQKRIAGILDAADALRAKRREALAQLDTLLQSTFLDMFGDPVTNPMGWETYALGEVGEVITGNTPSRKRPEYYGDDIEWIKSDNINDPSFVLTEAVERLSVTGRAVARTIPRGSILVTCIAGSPSCIGNAAIADREVAFNQQINAFVPGERIALWFAFGVFWVGKRLVQSASTSSMKGMVSKSAFSAISIPIPPTSLQNRFATIAKSVEQQKASQRAHLAELDTLFASLQSRAFRGDL